MGRHQDAGACFDRALLHKPDLANAWVNKGVALEKLGWWKQALAAHERARSLEKSRL
jgi:tetratricopeptide (TPR) repeat protein